MLSALYGLGVGCLCSTPFGLIIILYPLVALVIVLYGAMIGMMVAMPLGFIECMVLVIVERSVSKYHFFEKNYAHIFSASAFVTALLVTPPLAYFMSQALKIDVTFPVVIASIAAPIASVYASQSLNQWYKEEVLPLWVLSQVDLTTTDE